MATIYIRNVLSSLDCTAAELQYVRKNLSVMAPGYRYTKMFKLRKWDGKVNVVKTNGRFPTGLVPVVADCLESPTIIDERKISTPILYPPTVKLRDYQHDACLKFLSNSYKGTWWPRGVIQVATGGGKTEMAIGLIEIVARPTLFLVHLKSLLRQTQERIQKYGLDCGIVGDGEKEIKYCTVATVQTLWNMMKNGEAGWLEDIEMVIFDEAHLIAAKTDKGNIFNSVSEALPRAYIRVGLTATPFQKDEYSNLLLAGATGQVVYTKTNRELIDEGWLSEAVVHLYEMPVDKKVPNSWPEAYEYGVVLNNKRNKDIRTLIEKYPSPVLVMTQRIEHGEALSGPGVPFLCGDDDTETRAKVVEELRNGVVDALVVSTIFDEGIDIPEIRTVILAGGGKSVVKGLQRLGRGLRKTKDKSLVHVVDFTDKSTRWLKSHSRTRKKLWKEQGFEIRTRRISDL